MVCLLLNVAWAVCSGLYVAAYAVVVVKSVMLRWRLQVDEADYTVCSSALKIAVQRPWLWSSFVPSGPRETLSSRSCWCCCTAIFSAEERVIPRPCSISYILCSAALTDAAAAAMMVAPVNVSHWDGEARVTMSTCCVSGFLR
jgi:hypothetical protein